MSHISRERHQGARETDRRLRQGVRCHRPGGRATRPAYVAPTSHSLVNRASHYVWNEAKSRAERRFQKVKGNRAVKAAKRARQVNRRLAEARQRKQETA